MIHVGPALEATNQPEKKKEGLGLKHIKMGANINESSLQIDLMTDDQIVRNRLPEVTSPFLKDKGEYDPNGVFSTQIFGNTQKERRTRYAYIDLGDKFFHPYVYEKLVEGKKAIDSVARGQYAWRINDKGELIKMKESDPDYDENATGMVWLIKNADKIKLGGRSSFMVDEKVNFLKNTRDDWFIDKYIVIPVFYRDENIKANGTPDVPKLNNMYTKLISYANILKKSGNDPFATNNLRYQIQATLVEIRKYGQLLYSKKTGFFRQNILGKNTDYSFRSVISTSVLKGFSHPDDNPIDICTVGIPLTQLLGGGTPFIVRYILEFFRKYFEAMGNYYTVKAADGSIKRYELDDPMGYYNIDRIEKMMENFVEDYECRFDPIEIPVVESDHPVFMQAEGILMYDGSNELLSSTINHRYLTWCDLFYIAAVNTMSDKHALITRYPITSYQSIIPQRIHVLSTTATVPVTFMGESYRHYPMIDLKIPHDKLHTEFVDTITMANSLLKQMGGDYDGDTVSGRIVFSEEANEEIEEILHSNKHYLDMNGQLSKLLENEITMSYYELSTY